MLLFHLLVVFLGLILGSFIYTTAVRLDTGKSLLLRSSCVHCDKPIGVIGLIPLLGYLIYRGKCGQCHEGISAIYPIMELANATLVWMIFSKTGPTLEFARLLLLFESLFLLAIIDYRSHLIFPQPIVFCLIVQTIWLVFFLRSEVLDSILGLFIGAGIFHWVSYLYQLARNKVGLGAGDATLLGVIGFAFGWKLLFQIIFWSAVLGIVGGGIILVARKQSLASQVAFGPWLVLSTFLLWRFPAVFQYLPIALPGNL